MSDDADSRGRFYWSLHEARLLDARAAVQAGLHINGLAVTAMLAFLASVSPKVGEAHAAHVPRAFVWSLGGFALGVFSAALAAAAGYVANHRYAEAENPAERTEKQRADALWVAVTAHQVGYAAVFLMLLAFLVGVGGAMAGLVRL